MLEYLSDMNPRQPPAMSLTDGGQASLHMMSRSFTMNPFSTARRSRFPFRLQAREGRRHVRGQLESRAYAKCIPDV